MKAETEPLCIVVIDDDDDQLFLTKRTLQRTGIRHSLVEIRGGSAAIGYLGHCCPGSDPPVMPLPAVVFLDLNMPETDGFAVLEWIHGRPALRDLKVIMLTSSENPDDARRCNQLGAQGYLLKPAGAMVVGYLLRQLLGPDLAINWTTIATRGQD